jgi:hypothetical protein
VKGKIVIARYGKSWRGSVLDMPVAVGDILSPGWASEPALIGLPFPKPKHR